MLVCKVLFFPSSIDGVGLVRVEDEVRKEPNDVRQRLRSERYARYLSLRSNSKETQVRRTFVDGVRTVVRVPVIDVSVPEYVLRQLPVVFGV